MTANDAGFSQQGFDVGFRGRCVDVIIHPVAPGAEPPSVEAIAAALRRSPLRRVEPKYIADALAASVEATDDVRVSVGEATVPKDATTPCVIVISPDGWAAYAVPAAPPAAVTPDQSPAGDLPIPAAAEPADAPLHEEPAEAAAPATVDAALLYRLLTASGVTVGVLEDVVDSFGDGQPLDTIVCVARGEAAVAGHDAVIEYRFDSHPRLLPTPREDGSMDYHALLVERFVGEGAVLVARTPPVEGTAGRDVRGRRFEVPPAKDVDLQKLAGRNTSIRDGNLVAGAGGRPVLGGSGRIDVLPVFEVPGDLGYAVGNIDFPGDVVIRGDVKPGFSITAGGSVVVKGLVEGATIKAGHDLSVMGTAGEHHNTFDVGGNLVAQYLHTTEARVAGTAKIAREIVNCRLTAERIHTGPAGRIVGGSTVATEEIDAGSLGSTKGNLTEVQVTSRSASAVIRARKSVHPGVKLQLGFAHRKIEDEVAGASFWDLNGSILSLKPSAEETDANREREAPVLQ